jgi:hypothetical protein
MVKENAMLPPPHGEDAEIKTIITALGCFLINADSLSEPALGRLSDRRLPQMVGLDRRLRASEA